MEIFNKPFSFFLPVYNGKKGHAYADPFPTKSSEDPSGICRGSGPSEMTSWLWPLTASESSGGPPLFLQRTLPMSLVPTPSRPVTTSFRIPPIGPFLSGLIVAFGEDGHPRSLRPRTGKEDASIPALAADHAFVCRLRRVFEGAETDNTPLPPEIRPFDRQVLDFVRRIPFGKTVSYRDVAEAIGRPRAARAVGGALARNPLLLLVPCHRVTRASGEEGGYSGGVGVKSQLLKWETRRKRG